ncbi:MAG: hypothetical protein HY719_15985 [Planctomycetes bacterium]|nr:hypothetical protein [Planctomycetota bacterium]
MPADASPEPRTPNPEPRSTGRLAARALVALFTVACAAAFPAEGPPGANVSGDDAASVPAPAPAGPPHEPRFTYGRQYTWDFQKEKIATLPTDWRSHAGCWLITADASDPANHVLTQASGAAYARCVAGDGAGGDLAPAGVEVSVRLQALGGRETVGGGVILGHQPARSPQAGAHYILRVEFNEATLALWRVEAGNPQRFLIASSDRADTNRLGPRTLTFEKGKWLTLAARWLGDELRAFIDGQIVALFSPGAAPAGGGVGLWTMRDAVTSFDDFTVKEVLPAAG